jgi:DNA-binding Lrp family transcriptional regulator
MSRKSGKKQSSDNPILSLLQHYETPDRLGGGMTTAEMSAKLGLNPTTVINRLRPMILNGTVVIKHVFGTDIAGRRCVNIVYEVVKK